MPKTYNLRLNSVDKISGTNNDATFNVNLSQLLPKEVEYWNVQMYFKSNAGYYLDFVDGTNGDIEVCAKNAYIIM